MHVRPTFLGDWPYILHNNLKVVELKSFSRTNYFNNRLKKTKQFRIP